MARKAATRNSARTSSARAKSTRGARISVPGSDAGFRLLFENSPLSMWVYDRDSFRFLAVNDAAVRRYGYSRAEFLGMDIFAIRPPQEVAHLKQVLADSPDGLYLGTRWTHRAKSGELLDVEITAHRIEFEGRRAAFVIAIDRTDSTRAEAALRESEQRLLEAQRLAHIGSWELDLVSNRLTWSDEIFRIFEFDRTRFDVSYEAFLAAVHPDEREAVHAAYTESVRNRRPYSIDHRLLMPDGRIKFVRERCMTYYDDQGDALRSVGTVQDITAERLAGERVRRANRVLATVAETNAMMVRETERSRVFTEICRVLVDRAEYPMVWIGIADWANGELRHAASAGMADAFLAKVRVRCDDTPEGRGALGTAVRTGKPTVIHDTESDPRYLPWREATRELGFRSVLGLPLVVGSEIIGAIGVYATKPNVFDDEEVALLARLAENVGYKLLTLEQADEHHRALQAMRDSDAMLTKAQEVARLGSWIWDFEANQIQWSPQTYRLHGIEPSPNVDIWAVIERSVHPDDKALVKESIASAATKGVSMPIEYRLVWPDGSEHIVWGEGELLHDEAGRPVRMYGVLQDITERRRAEQSLNESQRFAARIAAASPALIYVFDLLKQHTVYINRPLAESLGYTPDEVEAFGDDALVKLLHPRNRAEMPKLLAHWDTAKDGEVHQTEYRLRHRDGTWHWFLGHDSVFARDAAGRVQQILGTAQDITTRKQVEDTMRKLSSAVAQTADSVMITDRRGIIEYVNGAYERTTGFRHEEVVGRRPNLVKSGRHDPEFYEELWQTILGGQVFSEVFINRRKDGSLYYEEKTITPLKNERGVITHFISTGKDITERMQVQEQLQYLAHHDDLTRLPNRVLLLDRLKQALIRGHFHNRILAVLFLDLDHFKNINDTLGHNVGDKFLEVLAKRLVNCVREGDTVARLGGDEFAILLEDIAQVEDISMVARKILDSFATPFEIDGHELFITTSIGVSLFPNDGHDGHSLLKNADTAMYKAKELGRNNFQFYSVDMSARAFERLMLETHLRHALTREQFVLYYQPQVDIASGRIIGVEALIRWRHPEFGLLAPPQFIALAEDTGLIVPIGDWAASTACRQASAWRAAGLGDIRVAVNLSARQFTEADFVERMRAIIESGGSDGQSLELEFTEGAIMKNAPHTIEKLRSLSELGVRFAIDDFGTGYSSLSYLSRFPIHTLKIDKSFIRNALTDRSDAEIVKTIIAMAHTLELTVIAEGVEERTQLDFLRALGCDAMQGNYFSRPLPAEDLTRLLTEGKTLA